VILEYRTTLSPSEVLARAKAFFARRNPLYAAFLEKEGDTFATFRGQGGEELVIGVAPIDGGTAVRASTYLFDMQAQRFFTMLPPAPEPTQVVA
jgi:hypothetical protein